MINTLVSDYFLLKKAAVDACRHDPNADLPETRSATEALADWCMDNDNRSWNGECVELDDGARLRSNCTDEDIARYDAGEIDEIPTYWTLEDRTISETEFFLNLIKSNRVEIYDRLVKCYWDLIDYDDADAPDIWIGTLGWISYDTDNYDYPTEFRIGKLVRDPRDTESGLYEYPVIDSMLNAAIERLNASETVIEANRRA